VEDRSPVGQTPPKLRNGHVVMLAHAAADAVVGGIPFISLYRTHGCYIASEKNM